MSDEKELTSEQQQEVEKAVGTIFGSLPNASSIFYFNNEQSFGFVIAFSEKGFGFGEITIGVDKSTGAAWWDNEEMRTETCERLVSRVVGTTVEGASKRDDGETMEQTPA